MIIKRPNKLDIWVKQEPIDVMHFKNSTTSLLFTSDKLEVIHHKMKKGCDWSLYPAENFIEPEIVFVLSGSLRQESKGRTTIHQPGECISYFPVTEEIFFYADSDEVEFIYMCSSPVFYQMYSPRSEQFNELYDALMIKLGQQGNERSEKIRSLSLQIGRTMKLSQSRLYALHFASGFHHIGHAYSPIDSDSWDQHPIQAKEIWIENAPEELEQVGPIIEQCYENFDGTGYPYGLKGDEIRIEAAIISVVRDYIDFLEGGIPPGEALEEIEQGRNTLYRPDVVDVLLGL